MNPACRRRGVALFVVLGVMALVVIYTITAQTAVLTGLQQAHNVRRQILRRVATESLLAQAGAWRQGRGATLDVPGQPGQTAEVHLLPLTADDEVWRRIPGLKPLAGDALVTIRWKQPPATAQQFLINLEAKRPGCILLPGGAQGS